MKLNAYCIFDTAAGIYQRPFFVGADGEATRVFVDLVGEVDHPIGRHPKDYSVFRMGSFNDVSGELVGDTTRECLMNGMEAVSLNLNNRGDVTNVNE